MKTIEISGSARKELGKKSSKQIRKNGDVPCVIYGKEGNVHFYAPEPSFKGLIFTPESHFVELTLEGKKYKLILQDAQYHPVSDKLIHCDFVQVHEEVPVVMNIPVKVFGNSAAVKAGAKLIVKKRSLKIRALAKEMPEHVSIDITDLKINHSIRVIDMSIPNLEFLDLKTVAIVTISASRVAVKEEEEATEETAETAEPKAE